MAKQNIHCTNMDKQDEKYETDDQGDMRENQPGQIQQTNMLNIRNLKIIVKYDVPAETVNLN